MAIKHLCFDKDGTLIDVHRYWAHTTRLRAKRVVDAYGLPQSCLETIIAGMGVDPITGTIAPEGPVGRKPRPEVLAGARSAILQCLPRNSDPTQSTESDSCSLAALAELFAEVDRYQQQTNDYVILPIRENVEFLKRAYEWGFKLSVFSSDRRTNIQKTLEQISVAELFSTTVGGDDVKTGKPNPEGFLIACEKVGVAVEQSLYIGDTTEDLLMARAANGLESIGVTTGLATRAELLSVSSRVFDSLAEVELVSFSTHGVGQLESTTG